MEPYNQYGDLPQIPFQSEPHSTTWSGEPSATLEHRFFVAGDGHCYPQRASNDLMRLQRMQYFLGEPSPLTSGMLHANLNHGIHHQRQVLSLYPTPEYARHISPDRTSTSGNSSYATGNEARSPRTLPVAYGSPADYGQLSSPYPVTDHIKQEAYPPEFAHGGVSVNMRDLELYNHQPEPESLVEEIDDAETKMELDGTYEPDPDYTRVDSGTETYKDSTDSTVKHSLRDAESVQPIEPSEGESSDADYTPRSTRRRRSSASSNSSQRQGQGRRRSYINGRKLSSTATIPTTRVTKRGGRGPHKVLSETYTVDSQRHFPCPLTMYGCLSTFSSKNEWKRHVSTQHIKLGFWRCDLCATTVDPHDPQSVYHNDFNRKDLFTQHLRRMHAAPSNSSHRSQKEYPVNEENIADHQKRCFQVLRETPAQSSCLYCDETFTGHSSWENRMEHIGRHLEKDRKAGSVIGHVATWNIDKELERWLFDEGVIALDKMGNWKIGDGRPRRLGASNDDTSDEDA
ncbi:hypothetical protein DPSP01_004752 [Paraphaeosphaeria sporulosa]|uniref:C2H2-type domain-containing protein n=1 Tax=Paraphaeosphaeria sporulosa TaxID=1460663 RepID=A0A177CNU1_9PLEO|nr:uncharacterized protein CC84DRAFT_1142037 [Paraphaeosphaeria sporulosa]OAG08956.1 hypothetical protein CC84DRAFT_1142037 [Paraphaeosphaeria sporulosa]